MNPVRARAIALRRRRPDPYPWLLWAILAVGLFIGVEAAHSQSVVPGNGVLVAQQVAPGGSVTPAPNAPAPNVPAPNAPGAGPGASDAPVPRGVLRPPRGIDPGIHAPAPPPRNFNMPVIPPPTTTNPRVQAK